MHVDLEFEKQKLFLENIKSLLPANISFVDTLSQLLGVSPDSIYRRIRGETALTFDEIVKLCNHYKLSFDSLIECDSSAVTFNYSIMSPEIVSMKGYLRSILEDLIMLNKIGIGKIIYVADDIPIFHLFAFPELAAFKMYYWMKSVLNVPDYQNRKYSFENTNPEILEIGLKIREAYAHIHSVEIWTEYTINSLRKQIEYYVEAGLFENIDDSLTICNQAEELIQHICHLAETSTKLADSNNQNFMLYYSEIEIGNNCILVSVNNVKKVYLTYNTFNKMSTTNETFCNATNTWINTLIGKSIPISGVSEKQRFQFANKILAQLDNTRKKIQLTSASVK